MIRRAEKTPFTNRYLLDKIRAVALANTERDQEQAAHKILGLVQELVEAPAWLGLYVSEGKTHRLVASRGDETCAFPSTFSPDRTLKNGSTRPVYVPARGKRMGDARIPILLKGKPAGAIRIQTLTPAAGRFDPPTQRLLSEIAQETVPLLAALAGLQAQNGVTTTIPSKTGSGA